MNANELADYLEKHVLGDIDRQAAAMLRQQQAEIEALKDEISTLRYERSSGVYDDEPVAWMVYRYDEEDDVWYEEPKDLPEGYTYKPLYTHPAKTLTPLTEDECEAIINKHDWFSKSWREIAKEIHDAILRKAQKNPLQDKLDAIANKVVFGKAQEK